MNLGLIELLLGLMALIAFAIALLLFITDYKKGKVTSKNWLWWIIMPFALYFILRFSGLFWFWWLWYFIYLCLLVQIAVLVIYLVNRKKNARNMELDNVTYEYDMPDTCPHCKSPNTKNLQECEWCGRDFF